MKKKKKDREQNYRSNTMYGYLIFSSEYCGCGRRKSIGYQH